MPWNRHLEDALAVTEVGGKLRGKFGSMGLWNTAPKNDLPSWKPSPWQRFYIPKEALFQRILGLFTAFSDSLHKCCVMCASLFFWRIAAASNAVVWHLTPALPFCWEIAELKSLPAALLVEEISASDPWCALSGNGLCLTPGSRRAVFVSSTAYHLLATPVCIPQLGFCGAKSCGSSCPGFCLDRHCPILVQRIILLL